MTQDRAKEIISSVLLKLPAGEIINPVMMANIRFFLRHPEIKFDLEHNDYALSCEDAAAKRIHLNWEGIPIHKELKTIASIYQLDNGNYQIVLAHCPADEKIDNSALKAALGTEKKLQAFQTEAVSFGQFSPFLFDRDFIEKSLKKKPFQIKKRNDWKDFDLQQLDSDTPVLHIFHSDLIGKPRSIQTLCGPIEHCISVSAFDYMTTNFGHHELGVGFSVQQAIKALEEEGVARVASITQTQSLDLDGYIKFWGNRDVEYSSDRIGIITGSDPASAEHLKTLINQKYREALGDKYRGERCLPEFIIYADPALDVPVSMDNYKELAGYLKEDVEILKKENCSLITLASDALDVFDDTIVRAVHTEDGRLTRTKYVPRHSPVKEVLHKSNITDVAVIGAESVSSLGFLSPYQTLSKYYNVHTLTNPQDLPKNCVLIVASGDLSNEFNSDAINEDFKGDNILDTTELYAARIANMAVNAGLYERVYWDEIYSNYSYERFEAMYGPEEEKFATGFSIL